MNISVIFGDNFGYGELIPKDILMVLVDSPRLSHEPKVKFYELNHELIVIARDLVQARGRGDPVHYLVVEVFDGLKHA